MARYLLKGQNFLYLYYGPQTRVIAEAVSEAESPTDSVYQAASTEYTRL
jgi:hypothetical protein